MSKKSQTFEDFFTGDIEAVGGFFSIFGKLKNIVKVEFDPKWEGNVCILKEKITLENNKVSHREWRIIKSEDGRYEATAEDIVGKAKAVANEDSINWKYKLKYPVKNKSITFSFDDKMYFMNDDSLLNRAKMKKFGVPLGELILFYRKKTK